MDLKKKIEKTKVFFPWYKWDSDALAGLPLMTEDILQKNYYNRHVWRGCNVYETSGTSTGKRKLVSYSQKDEDTWVQKKVAIFKPFLKGEKIYRAIIDVGQGHVCEKAPEVLKRLDIVSDVLDIEEPIDYHVYALQSLQPELLYTTPSILEKIIQNIEDPLSIGLRKLIIIGETVTPYWIRKISEVFAITDKDIHVNYGCTELGTMATYDHDLRMYISTDNMVFEGIKEIDGEQCKEDEDVLVVTCFDREFFPSLRFVTYDVVKNLTNLSDGRYGFDNVVRRAGKEMKHGERISTHDIDPIIKRHTDNCQITYDIQNNCLSITVENRGTEDLNFGHIKSEIEHAIPEIGKMIESGLIEPIVITVKNPEED